MEKYTAKQLKEAFDKVCDPNDWKNPIKTVISLNENREIIREAIIYFTGTIPIFVTNGKEINVSALGYRMGLCGDY